jgi:hypothetical protein
VEPTKQQPPLISLDFDVRVPIKRTGAYKKPMARRHILLEVPNYIPIHPPIIILTSPEAEIPPNRIPLLPLNMIVISQNAIDENPPSSMRTKNQSSSRINMRAGSVCPGRKKCRIVFITRPSLQKLSKASASRVMVGGSWKSIQRIRHSLDIFSLPLDIP